MATTELVGHDVMVMALDDTNTYLYQRVFIYPFSDEALPCVLPSVIESLADAMDTREPDRSRWHWFANEVRSFRGDEG